MSLIKLDNIYKSYGKGDAFTPVLEDVSLEIETGEFAAIVGSSGSGKTTLMNIMGLLDKPDEGTYELNGQNVGQLRERERARIRREQIGFVFQNFNLIPRISAMANVELPMIYDQVSLRDRRFQANKLLKIVGLKDQAKHKPNQLSGGQMQRVAIARALANKPKIILADEPTGNLDSKTSETILKIFQKLNSRGHTILVITHDPSVAKYVNRTISIQDGHIDSSGGHL